MLMHTLLMLVGVGNVVSQSIKLVPGPSEGRLEVNYNGTWGTVCQSNFANQASAVVCRSLNQPANHSYWVYGSVYGTAQVNPLLSYVSCTGTENSIFDCSLTPAVPNSSCRSSSYIVSIICTNEKLPVVFRYGSTWISPQQTVDIIEKEYAYCCAGNGTQPKSVTCDVRQNGYSARSSCCRSMSTSRRSYGGQANCSVIHWQYEETASIFLNILYPPESFMTSDFKILEYSSVNVSLVNLPNPLPYLTT
ncbi:scavenger receptor cysteine-rich type 1 protein M160-like isoform X1 [Haliotis rufescens]|uniref:scavenger receptor cysteine-rich type 1 protein M160-like isoform X1 n=1 Tax=Haliotis rufescens TaxID=6454 RepID=UPI00201EFCA0|nr:scavenger receptor cysteine-rich type 1 protein M160-like isoform X1 [Haliotis rufescens]XP_048249951.1 scavenger receptor cysteine-rich type 1 protein M160-like isoform X1 [Haliotis rufescens]